MLLGASGSGKSTLLSGLAGLLEGGESEGKLLIDGLDPRAARDRVGMVFQDPESSLVMARAGDEVAFGLENRCVPSDEIWPRVDEALEMVGFPYGRERPTDALSGGEQQRLALAAALALRPGLLLLDEPTANLDPDGGAMVRGAIARLLAGGELTMLLVEHRVADAAELVDRVIVLEAGGGVTADGPPSEVFATRGDELAAAGIWVPDHPLPMPRRSRRRRARTGADRAAGRLPISRRVIAGGGTGRRQAAVFRGRGDRRAEWVRQVHAGPAPRRSPPPDQRVGDRSGSASRSGDWRRISWRDSSGQSSRTRSTSSWRGASATS